MHPEFSHEMEDGFFDYPNSDSHGRAIVAFVPRGVLGSHRAYLSRQEVLLSLDCNDSQGSSLVSPNRDKGDQRT